MEQSPLLLQVEDLRCALYRPSMSSDVSFHWRHHQGKSVEAQEEKIPGDELTRLYQGPKRTIAARRTAKRSSCILGILGCRFLGRKCEVT